MIELDPQEQFVTFVEFNKYQDIGFYPQDLRIECCSCFLFLTTKRAKRANDVNTTVFNLLLVDPFHDKIQVAIFQSLSNVNEEILEQEDSIIKCASTSTMGKRKDSSYKMYLWTQFPNIIIKQFISRGKRFGQDRQNENSDNEHEQKGGDKQSDTDDDSAFNKIFYQHVPMIKDDYDYLFYVVKKNNEMLIMEGNPRDPFIQNHYPVFNIKIKKCIAFAMLDNTFFFMD